MTCAWAGSTPRARFDRTAGRALAALQQQGLIRTSGCRPSTPTKLAVAQAITPIVCVQNMYNVARREDDAFVDLTAAAGIRVTCPTSARRVHAVAVGCPRRRRASRLGVSSLTVVAVVAAAARSPNILLLPGTSSVAHLRDNGRVRRLRAARGRRGRARRHRFGTGPDCLTDDRARTAATTRQPSAHGRSEAAGARAGPGSEEHRRGMTNDTLPGGTYDLGDPRGHPVRVRRHAARRTAGVRAAGRPGRGPSACSARRSSSVSPHRHGGLLRPARHERDHPRGTAPVRRRTCTS